MQADPVYVPLARLVSTFWALLILGILLTVPLYKFNLNKFLHSSLFVKIMFWIPIFLVFLAALYMTNPARLILLSAITIVGLFEVVRLLKTSRHRTLLVVYFLFFEIALAHFIIIETHYSAAFVNLLISLCIAAVLADVTAFFMGNYLGYHKLPKALNKNKSWEGVLGEIIGAFIGVVLVNVFIEPVVTLWIFLPIGVGSVLGDLANSYVKRQVNIKDWSGALPGHGGFIDRLSSIVGAAALTFYFLVITGVV